MFDFLKKKQSPVSNEESKLEIVDTAIAEVEKIQARYNELVNSKELEKILDEGKERARNIARAKYEMMKNKIGLRR